MVAQMPFRFACALALGVLAHAQKQTIVSNEPLVVVKDGKYGYIDHAGKVLIKPQFLWAAGFEDGLADVYVCDRVVSIDRAGKLQPLRIAKKGELVGWRKGSKVGFVDSSGKSKIQPIFDDALPFSEGLAAVQVGDKWGFVDPNGRIVIAPRFDNAFYFYEGVASVNIASGDFLIDRKGKVITAKFGKFEPALNIAEGRVPMSRGDHFGFLDFRGQEVIAPIYDAIREFSGGLARASKDGKWGYIDRYGKVVIPIQLDQAGSFYAGNLAPARIGKRTGFIDRSGKFKILLAYQFTSGFLYGDVASFTTEDDRWGYVSESGKVIWGPEAEGPDHWPLLGWSDEDKIKSCKGFPESIRNLVRRSSTDRIGYAHAFDAEPRLPHG
jgi:hypothetical protein